MIQSVQTTINLYLGRSVSNYVCKVDYFDKTEFCISYRSDANRGAAKAQPENFESEMFSCDGNPAKYNVSLIRRIRSRIYRCDLCKNTFDSYANLQKSYNVDLFSQNNRKAAR